ncbi:hypothetical protein cyc_07899 [Cyclospora cayetanensis]|uniref:Rieske domain-containing protein n=1 Tax=Cyclospora cayetanensis TaxID=88456 RepID=A0A1D3D0N5_9EIME|nr:hypothetical protein cyc_07899 [Cyclospora cayetanensis]
MSTRLYGAKYFSSEARCENGSENSQDDKRSDISEDDEDFLQHGQERASDAEEFLWGRSTATAAPDDAAASDGELFDEADYLRGEPEASRVAGGNEAGPDKPLQQQNWQTGLPSQNSEASDSPQLHRQEQQEQQEREKQQGQQEQQQGQQEQQFQKALLQQQNPKLARIMQSVFGKKKPVGRFGPFVQQISDQQQASSRASGEEKASGMQPREGSSVARAAGAVAATDHVSTVELSISPMAVRNLKDANLLLKREGCSGDGSKQQQYLYEIEDGHLAYQHPRFCIFAIFEKDLVLRCLSPLWQRLCSLYDEAEAGSEEQQQQYLLLLQLLRCLSSLACPPPDEWIKFWLKFSAVLDSGKTWKRRVQDAEAVDKDAAGKDRLQGLSSEEQQAAQDLIEEERRKRSHIVSKYRAGLQKTKEALTCGRLWLLLAKFYFDQTLLLERKGRNTPLQQEIEELKARQDALYTREKLLKDQLTATHEDEAGVLEESPVAADTAEERQPSGRLRRGGVAEIQRLRASLRTELEALKEELFAVTEAIASANRRLRDLVDRAKAAVASVQHFVCAALELPAASTAAAMGGNPPYVAAQKQLRLRGSILQLLLQDVQHLLFAEMQRQFDLEGSSYVSAARRAAAAEGADGVAEFNGGSSAGAEGKALGSWSVTSVHNDLMQKIWRVLRTFHALAASLPPLQLAVFLAQNQQELQRILKKRGGETRGPPRGSSGGSGPQKTLNYPRLFGHTDVLLLPFDLEGDVMHQGAEGGEDSSAGAAPARGVGMCSSKDLSGSFCSGDWLYVGGEPLLHTSKAQEVHQLISGYIGISATFATPIDPQTHENALYTGRHYSFAFLIEAALKDKLRQVDADHHKPWDAELDESQDQPPPPQQAEEADEIQLLDRIDMIFCMQGYDTLLIHEFLLECMQQSVRVERLKHSSTSLCVAALRCLRQLLRMMEVHAQSRAAEIRSAVQQQFERWIGSGIVSDLSYALRRYKPRSTDPNVFLFAAECALSLLSLMQQLGGVVSASVDGFKTRKSRKTGGAAATALWDEDDFQQSQQHRTRQVTIDDIRSDFFRGDILSNCMAFVSRYSSNPFSVNSGMVAFMQELMEYRGKPNENVAIFFDLSHFLVFQRLLNDPQVTVNPRLSFLGDFAAWAVRGFFRLWRSNQLLPIELLFSKQRAPQTLTTCRAVGTAGVEDAENGRTANAAAAEDVVMTQHDFWCPASLPALQSLCSNYQRGTDAKVQQQMQQLPHLEPEEALKLAADEAAAAHGGQSAVWSGGVWTHEEDCMLMQYFEQFRGVRDYYTYIADLMGRHPKAVRKRLQHLRGRDQDNCDEPEAADEEDPNGSSPHGLGKDGERGEEGHDDSVGLSSALTAAVFAFRKKDWRAYCAEAGDVEADLRSSVTYVPEKLLHGVASALRDACRLQRQLEEMHSLSGGSASAQQEEIHVEEPAEAPMAVLDSPQFKALMEALSCTRKADSTSWCLRRDRQNELIAATVERLEVLASRELKVACVARVKCLLVPNADSPRVHARILSLAALAGGLIDFQRRLLELGAAAESQAAGAATGLFADDASSWESEAATAAATQLREPKEALAALVGAFKKLLQQLEGEAPPHEEDKQQQGEDSAEERRLLKLEGLTWFTGLQKERSLRRLLWLMGMECSDGEARWQLPKSVSAATWKDRLQVFEAMHTRDLDDLEMLVEDVRPRHADAGTNHPNRDRERDRNGMREGHASRKKTHSKHKSKDKGSSRPVDQPLRIKTYPPKPTPQQQLVLVQKLLQWRRFIEGGEMGEVPERAEAPEPPPSDESSLAGNEEISDASESLESRRTPKQTLRGRRRSRVASPESSPMRPQPTEETAEAHPKVSTGDAPGTDTVERPEGRSSAAAGELPQALQKFIAETEKEEQHLPLQLMEGVVLVHGPFGQKTKRGLRVGAAWGSVYGGSGPTGVLFRDSRLPFGREDFCRLRSCNYRVRLSGRRHMRRLRALALEDALRQSSSLAINQAYRTVEACFASQMLNVSSCHRSPVCWYTTQARNPQPPTYLLAVDSSAKRRSSCLEAMSFWKPTLLRRLGAAALLQQQRRLRVGSAVTSPLYFHQQQQRQRGQSTKSRQVALASAVAAFCFSSGRSEVPLGDVSDFPEGGIYEVTVNEGVATRDHVTCPWHDAKFDFKTGKCIAGPVAKDIQSYPVTIKGTTVFASLPPRLEDEKAPSFSCCTPRPETAFHDSTFVVVGGGAAASAAVEELRALGFRGKLVMISREELPPYDRIMLSKNIRCEPENILLRPREYLTETLQVDLRLGETVQTINADTQTLKTNRGHELHYDKACLCSRAGSCLTPRLLLLCTGSRVRRLDAVKGADASGVFYLRDMVDLEKMRKSLFSDINTVGSLKHVVVGSSFIGVEIAAALKKIGVKDVTVVGRESVPFERALGQRVGGAFKNLLESNNVTFIPEAEVAEFMTRNGNVIGVKLNNGNVLAADRVVVGVGVTPDLPAIQSSTPVKQGSQGGLLVDPLLSSASHPTIFAAGDIASFPYVKSGQETRVEHYATAMDQGRAAAANMLGLNKPFTALPFFWTMVFGKGLRYIGNGAGFEDVIIEGDLAKMQFVAYYTKGEKASPNKLAVIAAATMGKDPVCVAIGEAMQANIMPTATELRMGLQNSQDILNRVKQACIKKVA